MEHSLYIRNSKFPSTALHLFVSCLEAWLVSIHDTMQLCWCWLSQAVLPVCPLRDGRMQIYQQDELQDPKAKAQRPTSPCDGRNPYVSFFCDAAVGSHTSSTLTLGILLSNHCTTRAAICSRSEVATLDMSTQGFIGVVVTCVEQYYMFLKATYVVIPFCFYTFIYSD